MKRLLLFSVAWFLGVTLCGPAVPAYGATNYVFSDDFEAGMGNWTVHPAASELDHSAAQNIVPPAGGRSAYLNLSSDKMYHWLGQELDGACVATFYVYDGSATRAYAEVRAHSGSYNVGLQNVFAIGKYNSVTLPGEVYNPSKYQARAGFTTNINFLWFNLDAPGSPNRSSGWHRFDIVRTMTPGVYEFYVDGILSRTVTSVADYTWDSVTIGSVASGTTTGDSWFDGVSVATITEGVPERFVKTSLLPPPEGEYITPERYHVLLASGIVISNISHRLFTQSVPPLPPGAPPRSHGFMSSVAMEYAPCLGCGYTAARVDHAPVQVVQLSSREEAGKLIIETEMTSMKIMGGTLPPGMMIRESPTRASTGQTTIRPVRDGHMVSSFFDVFVEVSTDGMTWEPAEEPAHVELIVDPTTFPPVHVPGQLLPPPNEQYISPEQYHLYLANGIVIRDVKHKLFTGAVPPPPAGVVAAHTFQSIVDLELSMDGGTHWDQVRAEGPVGVSIRQRRTELETRVYDTEMTSLTLQGGGLPAGILIRESPKKKSEGGTVLSGGGLDNDCDSFFDIYIEVSTDGGGTWTPSDQPARVQLAAVDEEEVFTSELLPPPAGQYVSPQQWHAYFANGIVIRDVVHDRFTQSIPPPPPQGQTTHTFGSMVEMQLSTDGGGTFVAVHAPAVATVRIASSQEEGATRYFETEMEALTIGGGSLPPGLMIRESPTKASPGRTSVRDRGGRQLDYAVDSFFDIFLEVSTDGGLSWVPASAPALVVLQPAGLAPLNITCPPNQVVQAARPGGVMVAYPPPTVSGGIPPVTVTCTPPPGHFHVGVTPVVCVAQDAAGAVATCTFTVKVLPPKRFFRARLLPPADGMYISPQQWHALYANGIIISNVIHKRFTQGIEPPPSGGVVTHSFQSEVQLELGLGPDMPLQPHTSQADVTVRISRSADPAIEEIYETEMLQLDLRGGTLPPEIRVRVSPMRPSLGETRILPVTGGYQVSSFFDVFTEISTDGGATYWPAPERAAVELTIDPTTVPPADLPTPLLPPLVHKYVSPQDWHVAFANGIVITDVRHAVFTGGILPPPFGLEATHTFDSQVDMVIRTGMGAPQRVRAPATMAVGALHVQDFTDTQYLETEALQLNIAGGDLPLNFRLRESPTLRSQGGTSISGGGGGGAGGFRASSFFDIWVELSTDGGTTWLAATSGPVRVQLETLAPETNFPTAELPPLEGEYVSPDRWHALYAQGIIISNVIHRRFTASILPPPPGGLPITHPFDSEVDMLVSTDGGLHFTRMVAPAHCLVRISPLQDQGDTRYFDTEMLELNIAGGDLPLGVVIRESPTRASTGRTSERGLAIEQVGISSFFDVFTELSTDGGTTWQPSQTGPATVFLRRSQCEPPGILEHPADTTTECTSNAVFTVRASGTAPLTYQWRANGVPLPSPVPQGPMLVFGPCTLADNGKRFDVVVSNACGSVTSRVALLTVIDTTPPVIICPMGMLGPTDPGRCCAVVNYRLPDASDACSSVTVSCMPPPGFCFPLGQNVVNCTAKDQSGNEARCAFPIVVHDAELPVVTCPPNMTVTAYAPTGVVVSYPPPTATDNCTVTNLACFPPSGSVFPVGVNTVVCTARDNSGNAGHCDFRVTVRLIGIELDRFDWSLARVTVQAPTGEAELVTLLGPTEVEVYLDPATGACADLDGDGRDQAIDRMTLLELRGVSSLGPIIMRLWSAQASWGEVEERVNATPGILDLPPFVVSGAGLLADSFFDVWPEVEVTMGPVPMRFHTRVPVHMVAVLSHKPPAVGEAYTNTEPVELVDESGQPTGFVLTRVVHVPEPPCPPLLARLDPATGVPGAYDVLVCWREERPDCRLQFTPSLNPPILWRDWTGPIETLPDGTKCVRITNPQGMRYFRLCAGCPTPPQ